MAYIQVEASVRTHKKFLEAGPAPSWLWLCSLAYCQEGLTDGFIPTDALPYLGVKNAKQLAERLEKAGLWDKVNGGWQVHDYLEHNRSASEVADLKARRGGGGKLGGRPKKTSGETFHENLEGKPSRETIEKTFPDLRWDGSAVVVDLQGRGPGKPFYADTALKELQRLYPQNRVTYGYKTETAFVAALNAEESAPTAYNTMLENLENHCQSHEWKMKGMAPALEKWLRDGLWKRQMDAAAPVAEQLTAKTNRTLSAASEIMKGRAS